MDPILDAFGVPAVVIRPAPDDDPIDTIGVWVSPVTDEPPSGLELRRKEPRRTLVLSRDAVPTVPRGTIVMAPERAGAEPQRWQVDGTERIEVDHVRVVVVPAPEPES
jgi:hypothetical protein